MYFSIQDSVSHGIAPLSFMDGPLGAKNKSKMAATERILKWLFPFALLMGSTKSLPDVIKIGKTYCF